MTRALVLGGAGFIGTAACKELMRRGVETIAAGRKERPYGTFTSYVAFDRDDEAQLNRALESVQPDVVLDLACYEPTQVEAMIRLFHGVRYVFVSSGVIYPDIHGRPANEDDFVPLDGEPPPEVDYMAGKRWCETVLSRARDSPWTVVRPPAVFGAADRSLRIAAYIQRVEDGGPLLVPQETYERQAGLAWVKDVGYACALACDPRKETKHRAYWRSRRTFTRSRSNSCRTAPAPTALTPNGPRVTQSTGCERSSASSPRRSRTRSRRRWPGIASPTRRTPATPTGRTSAHWSSPEFLPTGGEARGD